MKNHLPDIKRELQQSKQPFKDVLLADDDVLKSIIDETYAKKTYWYYTEIIKTFNAIDDRVKLINRFLDYNWSEQKEKEAFVFVADKVNSVPQQIRQSLSNAIKKSLLDITDLKILLEKKEDLNDLSKRRPYRDYKDLQRQYRARTEDFKVYLDKHVNLDDKQALKPLLTEKNQPPQLTDKLSEKEVENLFNELVKQHFIAKETSYKAFSYVFGVNKHSADYMPLKWTKTNALLAYFTDNLIYDETSSEHFWHKTETVFQVKNLSQSKNNYLANKHNNGKPKGANIIDEILKPIK